MLVPTIAAWWYLQKSPHLVITLKMLRIWTTTSCHIFPINILITSSAKHEHIILIPLKGYNSCRKNNIFVEVPTKRYERFDTIYPKNVMQIIDNEICVVTIPETFRL